MAKLFNNIRKKIISENQSVSRSRNYLKYAIGEIVLVVIGILIALSINNWNEIRKTNIEEQQALTNIQRDFLINKTLLTELMSNTKIGIKSGSEILNYTGYKKKPKTQDAFNVLLNKIFNNNPYYPQNGFLDDLLNSGKLAIFKNVELRNLLSSWKANLEVLNEQYFSSNESEISFNKFIIKNASWLNADGDGVMTKKRSVKFPKSGFDIDNRNMLNNIEFENLTENFTIAQDNYLSKQEEIQKLLNNILKVIQSEIPKK
jgi:Family of unknown function (DUF6090)